MVGGRSRGRDRRDRIDTDIEGSVHLAGAAVRTMMKACERESLTSQQKGHLCDLAFVGRFRTASRLVER